MQRLPKDYRGCRALTGPCDCKWCQEEKASSASPACSIADRMPELLAEARDELQFLHEQYMREHPMSEGMPRVWRLLDKLDRALK